MTETQERWRPLRPVQVVPRPQGVFWAKVPDRTTARGLLYATGGLCWKPEHPVYLAVRPLHATMPGCQGTEKTRTFYVCATCSPVPEEDA